MKKVMKSVISVAVASSMLLSLAGCSDKANDEVIEAADSYASAVASMSYKNISKLVSEDVDEEDLEALDFFCSYSDSDSLFVDYADIIDAAKATITYEVDEESVDASTKDGEGEIDIVFTLVDLEAVVSDDENTTDIDTLCDAIEDGDTMEITVTVEYVLEDDEWKVADINSIADVFEAIFDAAETVSFTPDLIDCIDYADWWFDDADGVYSATSTIDLELYFIDGTDYSGVNYDVTYNGEVIYTGSGYDAWVSAYETTVADENDYYPAGDYTITFYDADGNEIYSDTCTVTENYVVEETTVETTADSGSDPIDVDLDSMVSGDVVYLENESAFYAGTSAASFYDVDANTTCDSYSSGATTLQLTCQDNDGIGEAVYYEWYYSATGSSADADVIYSATITPTAYGNGDFYDFNLEGVTIEDGSYWIVVADETATVAYEVAYCTVG